MEWELPGFVDEQHVERPLTVSGGRKLAEHSAELTHDAELVGHPKDNPRGGWDLARLGSHGDVGQDVGGDVGNAPGRYEQAGPFRSEGLAERARDGENLLVGERGDGDAGAVGVVERFSHHPHQRVGLSSAGGRPQQDPFVIGRLRQGGRQGGDGACGGVDVAAGRGRMVNRGVGDCDGRREVDRHVSRPGHRG